MESVQVTQPLYTAKESLILFSQKPNKIKLKMRVFVLLWLLSVAKAQYDYSVGNHEEISSGAAQLSEPIQPLLNEFNKEFYSYSAPDAEFDDAAATDHINSLKKALRVVFIKGPENTALEKAALQLAKSASDDRTAIYVLNKQADISSLVNQINAQKNSNANKPEVHFVKYRTAADAENAKRTIQSQYDSLPGPSSTHNAGSAPVLDFASKSSGLAASLASSYISPPSTYLPPGRRL